jgi:protein-disulfide isomerase
VNGDREPNLNPGVLRLVVERRARSRPSTTRSRRVSTQSTPHLSRRERRAMERRSAGSHPRPGPSSVRRSVWRSPLVIVTAGALLLMAGVIAALLVTSNSGDASTTISIVQPPATGINEYADGEAIGPADAPVVLEVYADYQCPWCGKFARETLPGLVRTYVAAGHLRIEERAIAFLGTGSPDESLDAAAAAACAAPTGKYWSFADYLAWNQSGENDGAFSRDRLFAMAGRVGLDRDTFAACLDDPATRGAIETRTAEAFNAGIQSTPTFAINGELVTVNSFDELGPIIQAKIDAAAAS